MQNPSVRSRTKNRRGEIPLHIINPDKPVNGQEPPPLLKGYAWGATEIDAEAPECLAKTGVVNGETRYWVKYCTAGTEAGNLFNPHSMYSTPDMLHKHLKEHGRDQYEFKRVPEEAFHCYVNFLKTGYTAHLNNASRLQ